MNEITNEYNKIDELLVGSQQTVIEAVKILNNRSQKQDEKINELEKDLNESKGVIETIKGEIDVLGSPIHTCRKAIFMKKCKARVFELLDKDMSSYKYKLFAPFFYKKIYADVTKELDVGDYRDISMKDWELPGSYYDRAKTFVGEWKPSDTYVNYCLSVLVKSRDNALLKPERNRALTQYYASVNSQRKNPFAA